MKWDWDADCKGGWKMAIPLVLCNGPQQFRFPPLHIISNIIWSLDEHQTHRWKHLYHSHQSLGQSWSKADMLSPACWHAHWNTSIIYQKLPDELKVLGSYGVDTSHNESCWPKCRTSMPLHLFQICSCVHMHVVLEIWSNHVIKLFRHWLLQYLCLGTLMPLWDLPCAQCSQLVCLK